MMNLLEKIFIFIIFIRNSFSWILNFDLIPNSNNELYVPSLEDCKIHYWTEYNTECMDGCTVTGELRYGPNYLSSDIKREFPKSIGINCKFNTLGIFNNLEIQDFWITMDLCIDEFASFADLILFDLNNINYKPFKSSVPIQKINQVSIKNQNQTEEIETIYIGAYYMSSISKLIKYKYSIQLYFKYSIFIDMLLVCLLLLNSILFKYRLIRLNKIKDN